MVIGGSEASPINSLTGLEDASFESTDAEAVLMSDFARQNLAFTQHNAGTPELANWDLETVIEKCSVRARDNAPEAVNIDHEEGKEWLQREESIRTNIINGKTIDITNRNFSIYKEKAELSLYSRRIGKKMYCFG